MKHNLKSNAKKSISGWLLIIPAILCVYFTIVRPQVLGIAYSFAKMTGFKITGFAGFDNYVRVVKDSLFPKLLLNTFLYTFWSVLIGYFVPILLAIMLNEMVHFRNGFRTMTYFPAALPGVAVSIISIGTLAIIYYYVSKNKRINKQSLSLQHSLNQPLVQVVL